MLEYKNTFKKNSQAIKNMENVKEQGPDGLTAMYYKYFEEVLIILL